MEDLEPSERKNVYTDGSSYGVEDVNDYRDGGFHPILLSDTLDKNGRYRVLHKLGSGRTATVWLCHDTQPHGYKYVAIGVIRSSVKEHMMKDKQLRALDRSDKRHHLLAFMLRQFKIEGPNGTHTCVVYPVYCPPIAPDFWRSIPGECAPVLRSIALQVAQAIAFLHKYGYGHGDFRPANILVELKSIDHLSEDKLLARIGTPVKEEVWTDEDGFVPSTAPEYIVREANIYGLRDFFTHNIRVIDFEDVFLLSAPPGDTSAPESYLPPEVLLWARGFGEASDIWALGCTLFEIRQQMPLFDRDDKDDVLADIVRCFGRLPHEMNSCWTNSNMYFDDSFNMSCINPKFYGDNPERSLEDCFDILKVAGFYDGGVQERLTTKKEQRLLAGLLTRIMDHKPEKAVES